MKKCDQTFKILNRFLLAFIMMLILGLEANSQNIAITDDASYVAEPSAMLDVKSIDKGLLIPRVDSTQRKNIAKPADGLLVYDTSYDGFFYYNDGTWLTIPQMNSTGTGNALFAVLNSNGDTVFAVYEDGAQVIVPVGAKGKVGGFAVSGRSPNKALGEEYLRVTPDSTRVTFNETGTKGKVGGFAVSGRSPNKAGETSSLINLFPDNYFIGDSAGINTDGGVYNTFFGYKTGKNNVNGSNNVFIGFKAGLSNYSANNNVFIGNSAGENIYDGFGNVLIGYQVAKNDVSSKYNSIVGYQAGLNNTGDYNAMYGYAAGNTNEGNYNAFFGPYAGNHNEGIANTFVGYASGYSNTSGEYNVFLGYFSGFSNNEGGDNVFLGNYSGYQNKSGNNNVFIGYQSGRYNSTASNNLFIGKQAGFYNATGESNVYLGNGSGLNAGYSTTSDPSFNTYIGFKTGINVREGSYNTYIGYEAGLGKNSSPTTTGSYNTSLGYQAGRGIDSGADNVFVGSSAGFSNSSGSSNIFIGNSSGYSNQAGSNNIFIGRTAGYTGTAHENNIFVGDSSGYFTNSINANKNVFIGYATGKNNQSYNNIFIGNKAGYSNIGGQNIIAIGDKAGYNNTTSQNIFIGTEAGLNNDDGYFNIMIGRYAGRNNESGSTQILIGGSAGSALTTGTQNIMIGHTAGTINSTGTGNVFLGYAAGWSNTGSKNVMIGYDVGHGYFASSSNVLVIDNEANSTPLIYGEFNNNELTINGDLEVYAPSGYANLNINSAATTGTENRIQFQENGTTKTWVGYQTTLDYFYVYEGGTNSIVSHDGSVGFNTNTPSTYLHVSRSRDAVLGTANTGVFMIGNSSGTNMVFDENEIMARTSGTSPATLYLNREGGNVNIGLSGSAYTTYNYGNLYVYGTFSNPSDISLKKDIEDLIYGLDDILKLRPVTYYWKHRIDGKQIGFIAQEVQQILPEIITQDEEGLLGMDYTRIVPVLVNAIQEQQQQINQQQQQINMLIQEIENLKNSK